MSRIHGQDLTAMRKRHDVFTEQDVPACHPCTGAKEVDLIGSLVVAVPGNTEYRRELTMLLEAITVNLFRAHVRQAAPAFEDAQIWIGAEQDKESTGGHHVTWSVLGCRGSVFRGRRCR